MTITYRGGTGQSSATVGATTLAYDLDALISGLADGDLMISHQVSGTASLTLTAPTTNGTWTNLRSNTSQMTDSTDWRITDGTEDSESWTWAVSGSRLCGGVAAFTGVDPDSPIRGSASGSDLTATATSFVAPSVADAEVGDMLVCSWALDTTNTAGTWSALPGDMDAAVTSSTTDRPRLLIGYETITSAGATGTRTVTHTVGASRFTAASVLLRPAAEAATWKPQAVIIHH